MIVEAGKTYIGKVRAISSERDTLALQLRLSSMLSTITLHPPGLPGSAIACIRRFRDPLPGSLHVQSSGTRPPHAWEQAVQASLKQLVEHAVHPARDTVPSNVDVVIFADQAEMLACMAKDWCEGNITGRWWWQGLLRGKDIEQVLVPSWLTSPEYIPAALQRLATMGKAHALVRALDGNDSRALLQSMIRSFGLYELQFLFEPAAKKPAPPESAQPSPPQLPANSPPTGIQHESFVRASPDSQSQPTGNDRPTPEILPAQHSQLRAAPWQPWMHENTGRDLPLERQFLLGIGLMLMRAPAVVRSAAFARAAQQWWSAEQHMPSNEPSPLGKTPDIEDAPVQQQTTLGTAGISVSPGETPAMDEQTRDTVQDHSVSKANSGEVDNTAIVPENTQLPAFVPVVSSVQSPKLPGIKFLKPGIEVKPVPVPVTATEEPLLALTPSLAPAEMSQAIDLKQPGTVELFEAEMETELGGLFYLINLGLFLNLYGDFTTPLQPGISLSIWDFITLLGQQLLGTTMHADPVWPLLAQLAGRGEQEPPGKDFDAPSSWRVPVEWLLPFSGEGTWHWNVNDGRLQVQHPEQFLVLDLPLDGGDPVEQLKHEMQQFADVWHAEAQLVKDLARSDEVLLMGDPPSQIEHWLCWLMPYIRLRLQRALGLDSADDIARILCKHSARITLTATHLDIVLSLTALPIEVRLSGLDRNPGWVPAAGRFIAFQFE